MSRRIDIELTSRREDGTWTWRAPGAKQPKGSLDGGLLPPVAKVGDIMRAEADFELEGITVVAVQAPRVEENNGGGVQRIEIVGSGRDKVEGVSVTLWCPEAGGRTMTATENDVPDAPSVSGERGPAQFGARAASDVGTCCGRRS